MCPPSAETTELQIFYKILAHYTVLIFFISLLMFAIKSSNFFGIGLYTTVLR